MKQVQFFEKVGQNRYALIDKPKQGAILYTWDEQKKRIVPVYPRKRTPVSHSRVRI